MFKDCFPEEKKLTYQWVDWLETSLHGLVHWLSGDDTWGLKLNTLAHVRLNGAETVDGVSKGVNDSAEHALTNGHIHDGSSSLDDITFLDLSIGMIIALDTLIIFKRAVHQSRCSEWEAAAVLTYRYRGRQYQHYQFPSWGPYPWYRSWTQPSHQLGPWSDRRLWQYRHR